MREGRHTLVLAAGAGNRMGSPKALMRAGNEIWWQTQSCRLDALGFATTWVVSPEVRRALAEAPDAPRSLVDADPDAPMFASLVCGLQALADAPPSGVFVLPVDVPAPDPEVWNALAATNSVAAPVCGGRKGHPIHLPWSWVVTNVLGAEADKDQRLDELTAPTLRLVEVSDPTVFTNLNAPSDLANWLARAENAS